MDVHSPRRPDRAAAPRFAPRTRRRQGRASRARGVEALETRLLFNIFAVTIVDDDGPGSLRQAIADANTFPGRDEIRFNLPGEGVQTIRPLLPLPDVTDAITIDGRSQPGTTTVPLIEIDGSAAGPSADGLVLAPSSESNTVRWLVINRFGRHGVVAAGRTMNRIESNYIGTDAAGQTGAGNGGCGVVVRAPSTLAGAGNGTRAGTGNVISGNGFAGVWVDAPAGAAVEITASFIGTDATGARPIGNGREGVLVDGGAVKIGRASRDPQPAFLNLISGNGASGIRLSGAGADDATIERNFIGTDVTGSRAVSNGTSPLAAYRDGVTVESAGGVRVGGVTGPNVISGNAGAGVRFRGGARALVQGNYIGTDATGTADVGNGADGVNALSVTAGLRVAGNVISGNGGAGLRVEAGAAADARVDVGGNYVGVNTTGTAALGNDGDGVDLSGAIEGALGGPAVFPVVPAGTIQPLRADATGRNVISGNGGSGAVLRGGPAPAGAADQLIRVTVQGNYVGTDFRGNAGLGNARDGVAAERFAAQVWGNLVSGNGGDGIRVANSRLGGPPEGEIAGAISGNYVGTNAAGTAAIGNGGNGIALWASVASVGGPDNGFVPDVIDPAGSGRNVISANTGHGILVTGDPPPGGDGDGGVDLLGFNYIGTNARGSLPLGNGGSGIYVTSGTHLIGDDGAGNVISGNGGDGVTLAGAPAGAGGSVAAPLGGNRIRGNRIGTDASGSDTNAAMGNRGRGVAILNSGRNQVGDATAFAGRANVIAFNRGAGVAVEGADTPGGASNSSEGNLIGHNSIFSNGGPGIDLVDGFEGVTANDAGDADAGPNRLQNFPVITGATTSLVHAEVAFTLNAEPRRGYRVDLYTSPARGGAGFAEGKTFLASVRVITDAAGNASGLLALGDGERAVPTEEGDYVTATATQFGTTAANPGNTSEFSAPVKLTAPPPTAVAGRYVFYNGSHFDGFSTVANALDDGAIATDKQALLPGAGPATFANYTSYVRGLNGIMIDVDRFPVDAQPRAEDFSFRTGREGAGGVMTWEAGPAPASVSLRRGAGVGGSDRITLQWHNYVLGGIPDPTVAVANGWLEVTMKATERTGLAADDVFAFGNLVADTGQGDAAGATRAAVNALDLAAVKRHLAANVPPTNPYDFNRDGAVNAADFAAVSANRFQTLRLISLPAPAAAGRLKQTDGVWTQLAR
jgi:hypothetical protein